MAQVVPTLTSERHLSDDTVVAFNYADASAAAPGTSPSARCSSLTVDSSVLTSPRTRATMREHLDEAHRAGRRFHVRVQRPLVALGVVIIFTSAAMALIFALVGDETNRLIALITAPFGAVLLLSSLLPSDRRMVRLVAVWSVAIWLLLGAMQALSLIAAVGKLERAMDAGWCDGQVTIHAAPGWRAVDCLRAKVQVAEGALVFTTCAVAMVCTAWSVCTRTSHALLEFLHRMSGGGLIVFGLTAALGELVFIATATEAELARLGRGEWGLWVTPSIILVNAIVGSLMLWPPLRVATQSLFARRTEAMSAAAGVATLLDQRGTADVMDVSALHFRCVSADKVRLEHLQSSEPDPSLFALARRCAFHECDCFVSHSWSDPPEAKFAALQQWRADFVARRGREPRLWLDKFCINQDAIHDSLPCLPVFLAGCNSLLLLCGDTYFTRLWCIMEVFVFLEMGGHSEQIDPLPLARFGPSGSLGEPDPAERHPGTADWPQSTQAQPPQPWPMALAVATSARASLDGHVAPAGAGADWDTTIWEQHIDELDVRLATCYDVEDRRRLLSALEASFGTADTCNLRLRGILKDAVLTRAGEQARWAAIPWNSPVRARRHRSPSRAGLRFSAARVSQQESSSRGSGGSPVVWGKEGHPQWEVGRFVSEVAFGNPRN